MNAITGVPCAPRELRNCAIKAATIGFVRYPNSAATCWIRAHVPGGMLGWFRNARDTVTIETPAFPATVFMVGSFFISN
jgi:hypothetical protein